MNRIFAVAMATFAAIVIGSTIGQFVDSKRSEAALAPIRRLEEQHKWELAGYKARLDEECEAANKADREKLQAALKFVESLKGTQ